jgi:hypothetical protein
MRNGEQFVMKEVRAQARERISWPLGAALVIAGLLCVPGLAGRMRTLAQPRP